MIFDFLKTYFTKDPIKQKQVDEQQYFHEWNSLFADIKKNMDKGPEHPDVQKLVDRWEFLLKRDLHHENMPINTDQKTLIVPEGIRKYAAEFADPSSFIQQAIVFRYKNKPIS